MSECRRLTIAQKAALVADGYTVLGGPYDSEDECEAACTAGTATATSTADEGQWWIGSPPSGGQTGGEWYSGEN